MFNSTKSVLNSIKLNTIFEFSLNVFTEFVEFSDKIYLSLKGFERVVSSVGNQDATTVPVRVRNR